MFLVQPLDCKEELGSHLRNLNFGPSIGYLLSADGMAEILKINSTKLK